jgi:hypothetical protein
LQNKTYIERTNHGINHWDDFFLSHCSNHKEEDDSSSGSSSNKVVDIVEYNYQYFAYYDANMVLPLGTILHVNYLCYLWHPIFDSICQFVLDHPVHPDDMMVSMIVPQLSGYALVIFLSDWTQKYHHQREATNETTATSY